MRSLITPQQRLPPVPYVQRGLFSNGSSLCLFEKNLEVGRREVKRPLGLQRLHATGRNSLVASSPSVDQGLHPGVSGIVPVSPLDSLHRGQWVKLICGASFEDVADIRNLSLVYTLAGVDCIDCAADPAVVAAVNQGIDAAFCLLKGRGVPQACDVFGVAHVSQSERPWVMVSVSDSEDPHFRKAAFDPKLCPADCRRPCERVCPTDAIDFHLPTAEDPSQAVKFERCYGCGRCIPACPYHLIRTESYTRSMHDMASLLQSPAVDAIEIHTLPGHLEPFTELWRQIGEHAGSLKLVAVSTPDQGEHMELILKAMYEVMSPDLQCPNLWQLDGRPMSGDLGPATAKAAVRLADKVLSFSSRPPGFLQLAGGTNKHSSEAMRTAGLLFDGECSRQGSDDVRVVHGIAFGGSARSLLAAELLKLRERCGCDSAERLEEYPELLERALGKAMDLVEPFKATAGT